MNEDKKWNYIVGAVAFLLIVGGAYIMWPKGGKTTASVADAAQQTQQAQEDPTTPAEDVAKTQQTDPGAAVAAPTKSQPAAPAPATVTKDKPIKIMDIQGMKVEIMKEGSGAAVTSGQTAVVNYTGMFTDGKVFDSSIPRGQPFPVPVGAGQVIKGWDLGLVGMKVGEKRRLTIPSDLGYGDSGMPPVIPPKATLVFDVELLAIQ